MLQAKVVTTTTTTLVLTLSVIYHIPVNSWPEKTEMRSCLKDAKAELQLLMQEGYSIQNCVWEEAVFAYTVSESVLATHGATKFSLLPH